MSDEVYYMIDKDLDAIIDDLRQEALQYRATLAPYSEWYQGWSKEEVIGIYKWFVYPLRSSKNLKFNDPSLINPPF